MLVDCISLAGALSVSSFFFLAGISLGLIAGLTVNTSS